MHNVKEEGLCPSLNQGVWLWGRRANRWTTMLPAETPTSIIDGFTFTFAHSYQLDIALYFRSNK